VLLLRKLLIGAVLAAIGVSVVASAATGRSRQESVSTSLLLPGVTYTREVDFTSRGPIVFDVVTAPKPDGNLYSLTPALSNAQLRGREPLTSLDSRVAAGATTVAIDGDYFDRTTGTPNGMLMQNGVLQSPPGTGRSSLGIAADGTLTTGHVSFAGIWQGKTIRRPLLLNSPAGSGKFSLYTPVYGGATPRESGVVEAVIGKFPTARLETPLDGTLTIRFPGSFAVSLLDPTGRQLVPTVTEGRRATTVEVQVCGQRTLLLRVARSGGATQFAAEVARP
jgi:hypothetical protein